MSQDDTFALLDEMVRGSGAGPGTIDATAYEDDTQELLDEMADNGLVADIDGERYMMQDKGRRYHSERLQEPILDSLAADEPRSAVAISEELGYDRCTDHSPRLSHDCGVNAVRRSMGLLHRAGRVSTTPAWEYRLSTRERERRQSS